MKGEEEELEEDLRERWPDGKRGWRSRYAHLLKEDPAFRAWRSNVLRASHNTGSAYFLRMGRICDDLCHMAPARIASMNRAELMTFVSTLVSDLEESGTSGVTIWSYVKAVKSWARFNGTKLLGKIEEMKDGMRMLLSRFEVIPVKFTRNSYVPQFTRRKP